MIMISALKLVQSKCKWSREGAHYQVRSALENAFIAQKRWDVFNHRKKNTLQKLYTFDHGDFPLLVASDPQPERHRRNSFSSGHLRFNSCWNEEVILGTTLYNKRETSWGPWSHFYWRLLSDNDSLILLHTWFLSTVWTLLYMLGTKQTLYSKLWSHIPRDSESAENLWKLNFHSFSRNRFSKDRSWFKQHENAR